MAPICLNTCHLFPLGVCNPCCLLRGFIVVATVEILTTFYLTTQAAIVFKKATAWQELSWGTPGNWKHCGVQIGPWWTCDDIGSTRGHAARRGTCLLKAAMTVRVATGYHVWMAGKETLHYPFVSLLLHAHWVQRLQRSCLCDRAEKLCFRLMLFVIVDIQTLQATACILNIFNRLLTQVGLHVKARCIIYGLEIMCTSLRWDIFIQLNGKRWMLGKCKWAFFPPHWYSTAPGVCESGEWPQQIKRHMQSNQHTHRPHIQTINTFCCLHQVSSL